MIRITLFQVTQPGIFHDLKIPLLIQQQTLMTDWYLVRLRSYDPITSCCHTMLTQFSRNEVDRRELYNAFIKLKRKVIF